MLDVIVLTRRPINEESARSGKWSRVIYNCPMTLPLLLALFLMSYRW